MNKYSTTVTFLTEDLADIRRKYLQLGREISLVTDFTLRSNLEHTHSKLGIYLEGIFGVDEWRQQV